MSRHRVLAAIDSSAAATPVLRTAKLIASIGGDTLEALHVGNHVDLTARAIAESEGVEVRTLRGDVIECIVRAGADDDVDYVVLGARGRPSGARPAGHVALGVMSGLDKPVIVVPPDANPSDTLRRVLVAIDDEWRNTSTLARLLAPIAEAAVEIAAVHVDDEASLPRFSDQPHYEREAFAQELLARRLPEPRAVDLTLRVGDPADEVLAASAQVSADLMVVTWGRDLSPGRAMFVRGILERATIPVVFVPSPRSPVAARASRPD